MDRFNWGADFHFSGTPVHPHGTNTRIQANKKPAGEGGLSGQQGVDSARCNGLLRVLRRFDLLHRRIVDRR
jgi:hypothetical protein